MNTFIYPIDFDFLLIDFLVSAIKNEKKKVEMFIRLIEDLPTCNRLLLSWMIVHMTHIIELVSELLLCPCLLWPGLSYLILSCLISSHVLYQLILSCLLSFHLMFCLVSCHLLPS